MTLVLRSDFRIALGEDILGQGSTVRLPGGNKDFESNETYVGVFKNGDS